MGPFVSRRDAVWVGSLGLCSTESVVGEREDAEAVETGEAVQTIAGNSKRQAVKGKPAHDHGPTTLAALGQ